MLFGLFTAFGGGIPTVLFVLVLKRCYPFTLLFKYYLELKDEGMPYIKLGGFDKDSRKKKQ